MSTFTQADFQALRAALAKLRVHAGETANGLADIHGHDRRPLKGDVPPRVIRVDDLCISGDFVTVGNRQFPLDYLWAEDWYEREQAKADRKAAEKRAQRVERDRLATICTESTALARTVSALEKGQATSRDEILDLVTRMAALARDASVFSRDLKQERRVAGFHRQAEASQKLTVLRAATARLMKSRHCLREMQRRHARLSRRRPAF